MARAGARYKKAVTELTWAICPGLQGPAYVAWPLGTNLNPPGPETSAQIEETVIPIVINRIILED